MGRLKENLNYLIYLIIYIVGCILCWVPFVGILILAAAFSYQMYIRCEAIYNLNMSCGLKENGDTGRRSFNFVLYQLLNMVTLGIYGMWWVYKQKERMNIAAKRYGNHVLNQFKDKDKRGSYFIIAGQCSALIGMWILLLVLWLTDYQSAIIGAFFGYSSGLRTSITAIGGAFVLFVILEIAGTVIYSIGWYWFYYDLNIISSAFNRETNDGNQIVCVKSGAAGMVSGQVPLHISESKPAGIMKGMKKGGVKVLSGQYAGSVIPLEENERIVIGRDAARCDLVCISEKVSRVHLSVRYQPSPAGGGDYVVRDMSSNGTSSSAIGKLPMNQEIKLSSGTVLTLGNSSESIKLL